MRKTAVLIIALFIFATPALAALAPWYKECMQRGYQIQEDYCVLPDSSRCPITDFNDGVCGKEFKTENYCAKEGSFVWDGDKCCEGTTAYLKYGYIGQSTCQKISALEKTYDKVSYWFGSLISHPRFLLFVVIVLSLVIVPWFLLFRLLRKKSKQVDNS